MGRISGEDTAAGSQLRGTGSWVDRMPCCASNLASRPEDHDRFACVGRLRALPRGRGRSPCLRHPGRGDARSQPLARSFVDRVRPGSPRTGRGVHGRRVRAPHRARGRLPRHARPGRAEPRHRGRRRDAGPRPARRAHGPAGAGVDAQGVPPVRRPRRGHAPDHEVERPRELAGDHPRGRAQGVSRRRVREAGRDAPRAARGRHGPAAAGDRAAAPLAAAARARPARAHPRGRAHLPCAQRRDARRARRPARPRRPRPARVRPRHRRAGRRDVHGQGRAGLRRPARAGHRRPAGARLRAGRLRRRRRRDHRRL